MDSRKQSEKKRAAKPNLIGIGRFKFDPEKGEPSIDEEFRLSEEDLKKYNYYFVQLEGQARSEWLRELKHLGAVIIDYIPKYTYLIKIDPSQLPQIRNRKYVKWSGVFQPAYKVSDSLVGRTGKIQNVSILVYDDGNIPQMLDQLRSLNASILDVRRLQKSKSVVFQNVILEVDASTIPEIAKIPFVRWLEYLSPVPIPEDEVSCQIIAGNIPVAPGYNAWLSDPDIDVDGNDEKIAVADSGFDTNNPTTCHQDVRGRLATADVHKYTNATNTDEDGHGTHVAGVALGNGAIGTTDGNNFLYGLGVAPNARLIVLAHFYLQAMSTYTKDAIDRGATVLNCSWWDGGGVGIGYNGNSVELDMRVRDANPDTDEVEPLIVVFSAGNEGWHERPDYFHQDTTPPTATTFPNWGYRDQSITSPKEAKNIIVVGATENLRPADNLTGFPVGHAGVTADNHRDLAFFSSRGPAQDERIVPTVVAPGMMISSLRSNNVRAGTAIDGDYLWLGGTSQAAPHVAGAVALICEWWRNFNADKTPSPAMVKALLINGADDLAGGERGGEPWWIDRTPAWRAPPPPGQVNLIPGVMDPVPSYDQGWGLVNLSNIINSGPAIFKDQTTVFTANDQDFTITVVASDPNNPLKITLVWSDAPATSGANPTLMNDLDLEVTESNTGNLYKGNWFPNPSLGQNSTGWSVPGGEKDDVNNVECVYVQNPTGSYEVKVKCAELKGDGIPPYSDEPDEFRQDFALVISNAVVPTNTPVDVVLTIDRTGSMKAWGYDEPARERAKEFVDMMEIGDHTGVVSFAYVPSSMTSAPVHYRGEKAYTEFELQILSSDVISGNAKNAIDGIWCETGPSTSIGAGLQEAQSQLSTHGSPAPDSIVILSDGYENTDPRVPTVMPTIPGDTKIFTLSLGEHSATELLEQMANDRGGKYFHAAGPLEVAECYYRIKGAVTGESISMLESAEIIGDTDPTHTAVVDACSETATFAVSWMGRENTLDLKLEDPKGRTVSRKAPYVKYKEGATYKLYIVSSPLPGRWNLHISGAKVATPSVHYTTVAYLDSSLKIQTFLPEGQKLAKGKPIVLGAKLTHKEKPVIDAQITANMVFLEKSVKDQLKAMAGVLKNIELVKGAIRIKGEYLKVIDQSKVKAVANEVSAMRDTIPEDLVKVLILNKLIKTRAVEPVSELHIAMEPAKLMFPHVRTHARKLYHAGNGVYLDHFTQTEAEGPYIFRINSTGYTEACSSFSRNDALTVNIPIEKEVTYTGPSLQVKIPVKKKLIELGFPTDLAAKIRKLGH